MQTATSSLQVQRQQRGFTLTEVVVILAVVFLLAAVQIPAIASAKGRTKVAQCASNLKQFTLAMHIYGNEYGDRLPADDQSFGGWPWDLPRFAGTFVENTGSHWRTMFCPGTGPRFTEADNFQLYNYSPNYRVLGYANTFPGRAALKESEKNATLTPQRPIGSSVIPLASERVMLADATLSQPDGNTNRNDPNLRFDFIMGGFSKPHLSPHLNGRLPTGVNVSMLDGHVEWRDFKNIVGRTQGPTGPTFWW